MTTLDSFFLLQVIFSYSLTLVYYKTFIGHPPRWDQIVVFFDKILLDLRRWSDIRLSDVVLVNLLSKFWSTSDLINIWSTSEV